MNLENYFKKALTSTQYIKVLGDQQKLHDLHYRKAEINGRLSCEEKLKVLVITESWCGDSTAILPVIMRVLESQGTEIKVALRDENPQLIDQFLTNGARAIPIIVIMDENYNLITHYGPRPQAAQDIFESYRSDIQLGKIERIEVSKKIRTFYAKDRGQAISSEFITLLNRICGKHAA